MDSRFRGSDGKGEIGVSGFRSEETLVGLVAWLDYCRSTRHPRPPPPRDTALQAQIVEPR